MALLCAASTRAQESNPGSNAIAATSIVHSVDAGESSGNGTVWSVAQTGDGTLFAGSNDLVLFDGDRWQKVAVPRAFGFRALEGSGDRLWVGAIDTLGYVERGSESSWHWVPLQDQLALAGVPPLGDIWSVHAVGSGAVWVTDDRAVRWNGTGFDSWSLPGKPHLVAFSDGDAALVYQRGVGLLRIGPEGPPSLLVGEGELPGSGVTWIVPVNGGRLIGLGDEAYIWRTDGRFERLDEMSAALKGTLPSAAAVIDSDCIAVATFKAGLLVATSEGHVLSRISSTNGLPDDNVYSLLSREGNIWVALGGELARIDGAGRTVHYDREASLRAGMPLKIFQQNGRTGEGPAFVLTTKALMEAEGRHVGAPLLPMLAGQALLRDAVGVGGDIWVSGFGGAWRLHPGNEEAEREYPAPGDVFNVSSTARHPGSVLVLDSQGPKLLVPSPHGGWAAHDLGVPIRDTPISMLTDADGDVWISTLRGAVDRFDWIARADDSPGLRLKAHYDLGDGEFEHISRPVLALLGRRLFALAGGGVWVLRPGGDDFEAVPELADFVGIAATGAGDGGRSYWLVQRRNMVKAGTYAVLRMTEAASGPPVWDYVKVPGLDTIGPLGAIGWTGGAGSAALWIGGDRGLLQTDEGALRPASPPSAARLTVVSVDSAGTPIILTNSAARSANTAQFGSAVSWLGFRFPASSSTNGEPVFFQTRLDGSETDWSAPGSEAGRDFSSLAPGHYVFRVRLVDRFGRIGNEAAYSFAVLAPWFRRTPALIAYGALLTLTILGLTRLRIERLRRQNERLEHAVAERTRELELSNLAKSDFLENISHELRNPLNGLMGMVTQLKEEDVLPPHRGVLRTLKSCAGQMTRTFEDVLGFSKLEYGHVSLEKRPFRLRSTLEEIIDFQSLAARQRCCQLTLVWPEILADGFLGDRGKIRTVVGNFLSNALKYAPGMPVEIRVEAVPAEGGLVNVVVEVADHGPGIPPEEQELIFKKFVRGSVAKGKQIAGTGLGLATCSVLTKLMNGSLGVESTPGNGAVFYLKLLLPPTKPGQLPPEFDPGRQSIDEDGPTTALIVEDELYNQAVLQGIALELGFKPDLAGTADEAFKLFQKRDYSVIFLDWELPDSNGGEVAQALRAHADRRQPIILATTAYDSSAMREKGRRVGMDGFLLKPFNAERVRRMLAAVNARRNGRSPEMVDGTDDDLQGHGEGINMEAFSHYARARPQEAKDAVQIYCRAIEVEAEAIRQAIENADRPAIKQGSHRLRSLAGILGARELSEAAAKLEDGAPGRTGAELKSLWEIVLDACEKLKEEIA